MFAPADQIDAQAITPARPTSSMRPSAARSRLAPRSLPGWHIACRLATERVAGLPSWVLLIQLFIGAGWLRAVAEKVMDPTWWTGAAIDRFVSAHVDLTLGWYQPFVTGVVTRWAPLIALVVLGSQLLAGLSLTTGRRPEIGIGVGMFLNLNFLAAGAVTPSAFYLLAQGAIALWLAEQHSGYGSINRLKLTAAAATFLASLSLPFISTLHPAEVIEDPAMMFAFGGALATLACLQTIQSAGPRRADRLQPGGRSGDRQ